MRKLSYVFSACILFLLMSGCDHDEINPTSVSEDTESDTASPPSPPSKNSQQARVDTYSLDWENIDFMPTPPGIPAIMVPWASGSSRQFAPELTFDYLKSEGWELLFNTFNTQVLHDHLYFILYNKYRGLIRIYYYVPNNANYTASSNVVHKMETYGFQAANSPIMNFAGQNVVDVNVKSRYASSIERWQVAPSTWYALQYELAYDPNIASYDYQALNFKWPIKSTQLTTIYLNGTQTGTLNGNIQVPGIDLTISPSINTGGQVTFNGNSDTESAKPTLGTSIINSVKGAITKGITGVIENTLAGIFKMGSGGGGENVSLKVNTQINLSGSLQSTFLLTSPAFSFPGYDQTNTTGFSPKVNTALGVFYISNRPTIKQIEYITPQTGPNGEQLEPRRQYTYEAIQGSFNFLWNPALLNEASISGILHEVVLYDSNGAYPIVGKIENIGGLVYRTGGIVGTENTTGSIVGVRISFNVVPNNGSAPIRIAKTFMANVQYEQVITDPGEDQW